MTEANLIKEIQNEISLSCALPQSLPEPEIKRIIQRARAWMYDNYQYAVEEKFIAIPLEIFHHPNFTSTRTIQMPDCVQFVYELREMTSPGLFGQMDGDFSDNKILGADLFLSPFQGDNLVYRTAMYSMFDLSQAFILRTVAYRYNKNTKRISVLGRNPNVNCYVRAAVQVPEESLYDDELFMRYCFAQAKINLGRILQIFNYNLPGGVTINFDAVKQDGLAEMQAIKEQIDGENTADWFLMYN
jgi:hypothetical protein